MTMNESTLTLDEVMEVNRFIDGLRQRVERFGRAKAYSVKTADQFQEIVKTFEHDEFIVIGLADELDN